VGKLKFTKKNFAASTFRSRKLTEPSLHRRVALCAPFPAKTSPVYPSHLSIHMFFLFVSSLFLSLTFSLYTHNAMKNLINSISTDLHPCRQTITKILHRRQKRCRLLLRQLSIPPPLLPLSSSEKSLPFQSAESRNPTLH